MSASLSRRQFVRQAVGALGVVALTPMAACDSTLVTPLVEGEAVPFLTPADIFYVRNGAEISIANWMQPQIAEAEWALSIDGLIATPTTVRFADLMAEVDAGNAVTILKTMRCVVDSNEVQGLIGTGVWTGVPLRTFLDRAGIDMNQARRLRFFGDDGFANNLTFARVFDTEDAIGPLLVTHLNGEPLRPEHGAPVRLIVPEMFGFKNVKWLTRIEATASDEEFGTYQDAGFDDDGVTRTVSRITRPLQAATIGAGRVEAVGFAVSGFAPIERVELAVDGGAFMPVEIVSLEEISAAEPLVANALQVTDGRTFPFRSVWVKWRAVLDLAPGPHTLQLRAVDALGNEQPETDTTIADGINAWPRIQVEAV